MSSISIILLNCLLCCMFHENIYITPQFVNYST